MYRSRPKVNGGPIALLGLLFVVFTLVFCFMPVIRLGVWFEYIMVVADMLAFAHVLKRLPEIAKYPQSTYLNLPLAKIGSILLAVQVASTLFLLAAPLLGEHLVLDIVMLTLYIITLPIPLVFIAGAETIHKEMKKQDEFRSQDVTYMYSILSKARSAYKNCPHPDLEKVFYKLYEDIQKSDPVSTKKTATIELNLSNVVEEMRKAVMEDDYNTAQRLCMKATDVLKERNSLLKQG